jgi:hypothetical protein
VAVPTVLVLLLLWIASPLAGLGGCDIEGAVAPREVGVVAAADGTLAVDVGPCDTATYTSIRLRGPDDAVVWQADSATPQAVGRLTLGRSAAPFTDVVPLAGGLDPAATYTVELSILSATTRTTADGTVDPAGDGTGATAEGPSYDPYPLLGGTATFRPSDLEAGTVWFADRSVTPASFERLACESRQAAT